MSRYAEEKLRKLYDSCVAQRQDCDPNRAREAWEHFRQSGLLGTRRIAFTSSDKEEGFGLIEGVDVAVEMLAIGVLANFLYDMGKASSGAVRTKLANPKWRRRFLSRLGSLTERGIGVAKEVLDWLRDEVFSDDDGEE